MTEQARWLLRSAELAGRRVDCRIDGGQVVAIGPELPARPGDQVVDCAGGALLPGLADHHIHLWATAAARSSVDVGGASDLMPFRDQPGDGWLRVIGSGTDLERAAVDAIWPDRPVRVQHRSGALWTLNSAAIELVGHGLDRDERRTGQLWRADRRLRALLGESSATDVASLVALGTELASYGITHVTDASPDLTAESLAVLRERLPQRVISMSGEIDSDAPVKIVITDHALPSLDELIHRIRRAREHGRPVAIHAVTVAALVLAMAALEAVGTTRGDRIEHAAVCPDDIADQLAARDVTVVTQPSVWARHGETFRRDSPAHEQPLLWRHGSLLARGVRVVVSSDAPYGDADPWRSIQACARRVSNDGPDERVAAIDVLPSMLADPVDLAAEPRTVTVGAPADLVLLDQPLSRALQKAADQAESSVRATFIRGHAWFR